MHWLTESNHAELKGLIEANHGTTISIKAILGQQQDELLRSLQKIESALSGVASALDGFADLAISLHPDSTLSDQALAILCALDGYETGQMLLFRASRCIRLVPLGRNLSKTTQITISEPRFIEDDLKRLVEHDLLSKSVNGKDATFSITRKGSTLAREIKANLDSATPQA
jgi:hypothetical protein